MFIFTGSAFALSNTEIPDEFYIKQHWISHTTSFDVETKTQKLGTLYRRFFSFLLTYDFYNNFDEKLATARSKFFSFTAHFDVYDQNDQLLGIAEEKMFTFFPSFMIYGSDASTKLATAKMNFWGTKFTIYDPISDKEMGVMSRSFFRLKNDWTIKVTNRALFNEKQMDARVLMTVLAFQGDRESWEQQDNNNKNLRSALSSAAPSANETKLQTQPLLEKIAFISKNQGLESQAIPDPKILESVANELQNDYDTNKGVDDSNDSSQEKINHFSEFCFNLVQSNAVSVSKQKAILYLLKLRLEGGIV